MGVEKGLREGRSVSQTALTAQPSEMPFLCLLCHCLSHTVPWGLLTCLSPNGLVCLEGTECFLFTAVPKDLEKYLIQSRHSCNCMNEWKNEWMTIDSEPEGGPGIGHGAERRTLEAAERAGMKPELWKHMPWTVMWTQVSGSKTCALNYDAVLSSTIWWYAKIELKSTTLLNSV